MKKLCNVDKAAAIRNGFNASSTVALDVNIPSLSASQREKQKALTLQKEEIKKAEQAKKERVKALQLAVIEEKGSFLQKTRLARGLLDIGSECLVILLAELGTPTVSGCTLGDEGHEMYVKSYTEKESISDREMALMLELEKIEGMRHVCFLDLEMHYSGGWGDPENETEVQVTLVRSGLQFSRYFSVTWN